MKSKVSVFKTNDSLYETVKNSIEAIGGVHLEEQTVLIKPNLVDPVSYTTGKITNPYLVEAIIKYCYQQGAREVIIGEGPSYYRSANKLVDSFTKTGMQKIAERNGAKWVIFDDFSFKSFRDISPFTPSQFHVTDFAFEYDKLINVPVMKTHIFTKVTLAMKNLKGCLKRKNKPQFHRHLARAVVELNKIVKPTLNIIDGTTHKNGIPFIVAGEDIVATDSVTSSLMGFNPSQIKTIKFGFEAELGEMRLDRINIVGDDLKDLKMNFKLPQEEVKRAFPQLNLIVEKACCGCAVPIFSILFSIKEEGKKLQEPLSIVAGKQKNIPQAKNLIIIGDCAKSFGLAKTLKGCPPDKDEIDRIIREFIS